MIKFYARWGNALLLSIGNLEHVPRKGEYVGIDGKPWEVSRVQHWPTVGEIRIEVTEEPRNR